MNIPIYRAKKIDSDEYVTGDLHIHKIEQVVGKRYIKETSHYILTHRKIDSNPNSFDGMYITDTMICTKIDPTTIAIHFPNMTDSQGSKIFASLSEDGKGGDIIHHKKPYCKDDRKYYEWNVKFDKRRITPFVEREYWNPSKVPLKDILTNPKAYIKVVGIQE